MGLKLDLPDVTLVMVETQVHQLAKLAVEDCLIHADFGDVVICSDQFNELRTPGARHIRVENWPSKLHWCKFLWAGVPQLVTTKQALLIQWDSWIVDPKMWKDAWLAFDVIGAPWWHTDGLNVGNSGFSLRSKALMDHLVRHRDSFPCVTHAEDALLSRAYRPQLEAAGFKWADPDSALDFAFERVRASRDTRHFGFHSTFNWPFVLHTERLEERMRLLLANEYIRNRTVMLTEMNAARTMNMPWTWPPWRDRGHYVGLDRVENDSETTRT